MADNEQRMSLLSIGLVRGLVGQFAGILLGFALVVLIRALAGYDEVWSTEPAWVVGAILGALGFLIAIGAMSDWFSWWRGGETPFVHGPRHPGRPTWARYFDVDYNHKVIGIQYGVTGLIMLCIGGSFAVIFRSELARSGLQFLQPATYNTFIGMHGWAALFGIFIGIGGMANYLVPLMIGADDMAFPRLNSFAFWINVPAIVLLLISLYYTWDAGWTVYPPLSLKGSPGFQLVFWSIFLLGFSSILGSLNLVATMLRMRSPGMSLFRMPIFCWAMMATSLIQLTATQLIAMSFLMLSLAREATLAMPFFVPVLNAAGVNIGGDPTLFQHTLLVLLAPCRLRVGAAGAGHHQRTAARLFAASRSLATAGLPFEPGDCAGWLSGLGPPHVYLGLLAQPARLVHGFHAAGGGAHGRQVLLAGWVQSGAAS
jgi:cytochrome c oxidase subunit 1